MIIPQIIALVALSQLSPITIDITADQGIDVVLEDVIIDDYSFRMPTEFIYNIESRQDGNIYINIDHKLDVINSWCTEKYNVLYNPELFKYYNITEPYNPTYEISTNFAQFTVDSIDDTIIIPITPLDTRLSIELDCELTGVAKKVTSNEIDANIVSIITAMASLIPLLFIIRRIAPKSKYLIIASLIITTIVMGIIYILTPTIILGLPPMYIVAPSGYLGLMLLILTVFNLLIHLKWF